MPCGLRTFPGSSHACPTFLNRHSPSKYLLCLVPSWLHLKDEKYTRQENLQSNPFFVPSPIFSQEHVPMSLLFYSFPPFQYVIFFASLCFLFLFSSLVNSNLKMNANVSYCYDVHTLCKALCYIFPKYLI